jgi:hypothetical protein
VRTRYAGHAVTGSFGRIDCMYLADELRNRQKQGQCKIFPASWVSARGKVALTLFALLTWPLPVAPIASRIVP